MPKSYRLLLLVLAGGACVWSQAGQYASDIDAANAGVKAINSGKAFARKVVAV
jgi:hypothetical protein